MCCSFASLETRFLSLATSALSHISLGPALHLCTSRWRGVVRSQGHANMLKTLLQHLDGIDDDVIVGMKVPRATPMVYELGEDMRPLRSPDPNTLLSAELLSVDGAPALTAAGEVNAF